jgi:hypothetical protein
MHKIGLVFLCLILLAGGAVYALDGTVEEELERLKKENAEMKARLFQLEAAMAELKKAPPAPSPVPAPAAPAPAAPVAAATPAKADKPAKPTVSLYGYVKLDAAYDTARADNGDFVKWVLPEGPGGKDDQFNMTANQTRIGLNIAGPQLAGSKTTGNVEIDFYSLEGGENKPQPMLRQAWLKLEWPEHDLSLLAGQTNDVISPLMPETVSYSVQWWAGNIGYRRPQLRLTKGFKVGEDSKLLVQGALSRTIGHQSGYDPGDSGEDAGFPTVQGRVAGVFPLGSGRKATFGFYGHYGQEQFDVDALGTYSSLDSYSYGIDVNLPVSSKLMLQGELWQGANLDTYLGGIGQGFVRTRLTEVRAVGGWATATIGPYQGWKFNLGGSVDDPYNRDLGSGNRLRNAAIFGNLFYSVNDAIQVGFEMSNWWTEYMNLKQGMSTRVQGAFIYRF